MKAQQTTMFQTEDLPLFSGTTVRAEVTPFEGRDQTYQEPLPANCHFCQDTGLLDKYAFCWCKAGQERKGHRIACNDRAYRFQYDDHWRVWRPDRTPHHFGRYKTEEAAQRSADRINASLGIGKEQTHETL